MKSTQCFDLLQYLFLFILHSIDTLSLLPEAKTHPQHEGGIPNFLGLKTMISDFEVLTLILTDLYLAAITD